MSDEDMFKSQHAKMSDNLDDVDIIPATPIKETKKRKFRKKKPRDKKIIIDLKDDFKHQIQMTRTGCFDFNKPFTYHNVEEVLKYGPDCFPKNNNIHLIGVHRFTVHKGHYLEKYSDSSVTISLDFTVASSIPDRDDTVSIFGSTEFNSSVPIFFVKFFRKEVGSLVNKYIDNLLVLRKYVPRDYFSTICNSTN